MQAHSVGENNCDNITTLRTEEDFVSCLGARFKMATGVLQSFMSTLTVSVDKWDIGHGIAEKASEADYLLLQPQAPQHQLTHVFLSDGCWLSSGTWTSMAEKFHFRALWKWYGFHTPVSDMDNLLQVISLLYLGYYAILLSYLW